MYNILTLNPISKQINSVLDSEFSVSASHENPDAILVRSFNMHTYEKNTNLLAVARAGAGVNNIPIDEYSENGIVVFNTPGANANAVKELVICSMFLAARNVFDAVSWVKTIKDKGDEVPALVEKGKKPFSGTELSGKTLGIVGIGAIGAKVANGCSALGMNIIGYDPYLNDNVKSMLSCSVNFVSEINYLYKKSDFISFHIPLLDSTKGMINKTSIDLMKNGVIIVNMSRAEIAVIEDVIESINSSKIRNYIVDFPTADVIDKKGIIAIPHLGASTEESEDNCAVMAAKQLKDYLENGNIRNSVNFPNLQADKKSTYRVTVTYFAQSNIIKSLKIYAEKGTLFFAERDKLGYAILDFDEIPNELVEELTQMEGIIQIRII